MRAVYTRTPSGGVDGDSTDVRQPLLPTARPAAFDVGDSAGGRPRGGGKHHAGVLTWLTLAILALVLVSFIDVQVRKAHSSSAKSSSRIQDDATSEFSETAPARSTTPKAPKVKATTTTVAAPSASPKGSTSDMLYPTEAMPAPTAAAASPTAVTAAVVPQYVPLVSTTVPSATTVAAPAMAQTVLVTLPPPPPVAVPAATVLATPVLAPSSPPPAVAVPLPATLVAAATAASLPVATPLPPPPPPPAAASVGSLLRSAFTSVLGGAASSPPPLVEGAPSSVRTKAIMTTAASGTLPKGFPNAPPGLPLLQWVDKYYYTQLGAPAPADLPPGPPNLSREQWAAQWTWEQQQAEEQAAQQAAQQGARGTVAGAAAPAPGTGPGESSLTMRSLASYDALAVCNDGSPGAFYYAPGSDPTTWLVFLQGGMWCWDAESCSERAQNGPAQVSSASWPAVMTQVGIFDSEASLNPFATANKVYIGYCSSDAWLGDESAEETQAEHGFSWAFRGRRILRTTLDVLVSDLGLGGAGATNAKPHRLVLAGCSAGARGAMFNLDAVAAAAPPTVSVVGVLDSPEWINVLPLNPSIVSLADQCASAMTLFNATAELNPQCVRSLPSNSSFLCLMGEYLMPYLNTPYFLNAGQFDAFQIPYNVGANPQLSNPTEMAYCNAWQDTLLSAINPLPTASQQNSGVFSLSCLRHCLTQGPSFWTNKILNVSFASALGEWFYNHGGTARYIGNCQTYPRCVMC